MAPLSPLSLAKEEERLLVCLFVLFCFVLFVFFFFFLIFFFILMVVEKQGTGFCDGGGRGSGWVVRVGGDGNFW